MPFLIKYFNDMTANKGILARLEEEIGAQVTGVKTIGGGSINRVFRLTTTKANYLLKVNDGQAFPGMFKAEATGLETIRNTNSIRIPDVILQDDFESDSFLILEWVETRQPDAKSSALLGEKLSQMHQHTSTNFGDVADNFMGSLRQTNRSHSTWAEFFIEDRLKPMVQIANSNALINNMDMRNFERLYEQLPELFQEEAPSLIHGDLWSGNSLSSVTGEPYLIDPAISYGYREFDIAMTTLFGCFSNQFYEAYNYHSPLSKGWEQRLDLWNLYPLLVHLNLFGSGYLGQVRDCLKVYT
jgi:fructosamine-3-kinase